VQLVERLVQPVEACLHPVERLVQSVERLIQSVERLVQPAEACLHLVERLVQSVERTLRPVEHSCSQSNGPYIQSKRPYIESIVPDPSWCPVEATDADESQCLTFLVPLSASVASSILLTRIHEGNIVPV